MSVNVIALSASDRPAKRQLSPKMQIACSSIRTHTTCIRPPRQKAMSEDMSERMSEDISEDLSERMSKDMSERTSGDELYVYPHLTRSG